MYSQGIAEASAMAIVKIPPTTAILDCVPECSPTISPRVVIIPEVKPKLTPVLSWCFMVPILADFEARVNTL